MRAEEIPEPSRAQQSEAGGGGAQVEAHDGGAAAALGVELTDAATGRFREGPASEIPAAVELAVLAVEKQFPLSQFQEPPEHSGWGAPCVAHRPASVVRSHWVASLCMFTFCATQEGVLPCAPSAAVLTQISAMAHAWSVGVRPMRVAVGARLAWQAAVPCPPRWAHDAPRNC